jgi:hypothetical protein
MRIEPLNYWRFSGADNIDMESSMTGAKCKRKWVSKCMFPSHIPLSLNKAFKEKYSQLLPRVGISLPEAISASGSRRLSTANTREWRFIGIPRRAGLVTAPPGFTDHVARFLMHHIPNTLWRIGFETGLACGYFFSQIRMLRYRWANRRHKQRIFYEKGHFRVL